MNITVLGLTNPEVNLKRMHQLYIVYGYKIVIKRNEDLNHVYNIFQ